MAILSAHDVAAELRRRLPGIGVLKLHKLLYYCQGHHLAQFDEPLFAESVMAYDHGPLVAQLWYREKQAGQSSDSLPEPRELGLGPLNTVAYVVSRYGDLTGADLERLTHSEPPWLIADQYRAPGVSERIETAGIARFFGSAATQEHDPSVPALPELRAWLGRATDRRPSGELPEDTDEDILERLRTLAWSAARTLLAPVAVP